MDGLTRLLLAPALLLAAAPALAQGVGVVVPGERIGQPTPAGYVIQPQVTAIGRDAQWMHDVILMPLIIAIGLFVLALLLWVIVRYRAAAQPVPTRTSHNTFIEIVWTVLPVLILVAIAIPSIDLLRAQYSPPKADITVKVIGHQWYWSYQYPDNGDFEIVSNILSDDRARESGQPRLLGVDEKMVVPAGKTVKIIVTSDDVIHSFAVPAFWTKMDAVPGRLNETWFKVDRPGTYYGQCSELCGAKHAYMPIAVEVVPPVQFAQWVASKGGSMTPVKAGADATSRASPATSGAGPAPAASPVPTVSGTAAPQPTDQGATANQGPTA